MLSSDEITFDMDGTPMKIDRTSKFSKPSHAKLTFRVSSIDSVATKVEEEPPLVETKYSAEFEPGQESSWLSVIDQIVPGPGVTIKLESGKEIRGPPMDQKGRMSRSEYKNLLLSLN